MALGQKQSHSGGEVMSLLGWLRVNILLLHADALNNTFTCTQHCVTHESLSTPCNAEDLGFGCMNPDSETYLTKTLILDKSFNISKPQFPLPLNGTEE